MFEYPIGAETIGRRSRWNTRSIFSLNPPSPTRGDRLLRQYVHRAFRPRQGGLRHLGDTPGRACMIFDIASQLKEIKLCDTDEARLRIGHTGYHQKSK